MDSAKIKLEYFTDMEVYDIYRKTGQIMSCDGCKYFKTVDDSFVFEGEKPENRLPVFQNHVGSVKARGYIQTNLSSSSGQKWQGIMDTGKTPKINTNLKTLFDIIAWFIS